MSKNVLVIGGGAAGMFAAMKAREMGANVTIVEKNNKLGKKLLITGKGRCNITNAGTLQEIINNMPGNGPFLYSALYALTNQEVVDIFRGLGVPTKVERGGRVFPESDRAHDVVEALENYLRNLGVIIKLNTSIDKLVVSEGKIEGVRAGGSFLSADAVVVATGGVSYPGTGSTGDGHKMAREVHHTVTPLTPSLVPLETAEIWVKEIQGLALKNVEVTAWGAENKIASEFGEMLFTHFGVTGPIILSLSKPITTYLNEHPNKKVQLTINLKPALTPEQLDNRLKRDFQKFSRKQLSNAFGELLPKSLIPVFVKLLPVSPEKPVHQITRQERWDIIKLLREFPLTVTRTRPLAEAIVTAGGINVKEINPKSMESKLIKRLYFAGEVMDVDGFTGGYNLQAAFSTGYVAGMNAAE